MAIAYAAGITGDDIVNTFQKNLRNHDLLFTTDTGLYGRFCTGGSGPRLEIFTQPDGFSGHVCGCSLEEQKGWLGKDSKGEIRYGCQYGLFDVHLMSLKTLIENLAPKWVEEAEWKMRNALSYFENVEKLVLALK